MVPDRYRLQYLRYANGQRDSESDQRRSRGNASTGNRGRRVDPDSSGRDHLLDCGDGPNKDDREQGSEGLGYCLDLGNTLVHRLLGHLWSGGGCSSFFRLGVEMAPDHPCRIRSVDSNLQRVIHRNRGKSS